jgi:hypothetical protein
VEVIYNPRWVSMRSERPLRDILGPEEARRMLLSRGGGGSSGEGGRLTGTGGEPPRPPHLIRPDEVDAWLADSANKRVTYHRTTYADAQDIIEHGVDIARSRVAAYGQGFYTRTTRADELHLGEAEVPIAIRTLHPLAGEYETMDAEIERRTRLIGGAPGRLTHQVAGAIRRELLQEGYDRMVIRDAEGVGVDFVVALEASSVKVVQP